MRTCDQLGDVSWLNARHDIVALEVLKVVADAVDKEQDDGA